MKRSIQILLTICFFAGLVNAAVPPCPKDYCSSESGGFCKSYRPAGSCINWCENQSSGGSCQ